MLLRASCSYVPAPEQSIIPIPGEALHVLVLDRNIKYLLSCMYFLVQIKVHFCTP